MNPKVHRILTGPTWEDIAILRKRVWVMFSVGVSVGILLAALVLALGRAWG